MALLDAERRAEVRELINYPESVVGRSMTTDFMILLPSTTVLGAIDKLRECVEREPFFFYLYVVDETGKLVGVVPLRNLDIALPDLALSETMIADPIKALVLMDQQEAALLVSKIRAAGFADRR
jgi:magnesium transporter